MTRARVQRVAATAVRPAAAAALDADGWRTSGREAASGSGGPAETGDYVEAVGGVVPANGASEAVLDDFLPCVDDDDVDEDDDDEAEFERPPRGALRPAEPAPLRQRLAAAAGDRLPPTLRSAIWSMDGRSVVVLIAVGVGAVVAALLAFGGSPNTDAVVVPTFEPAATSVTSDPTAPVDDEPTGTNAPTVVVDVAGLVAKPGVYELPAGSRVIDAVEAAGGAIEGTDLSQLNLARLVSDGEQIAVGVPAAPGVPGGATSGSPESESAGPLDLNTATEAQLDELPGVGPVLAERIVSWREENGQFSSVEELMEVSGIGAATFADLEPLVRV